MKEVFMGALVDLTGQKFGFLTVLERDIEIQKQKNSQRAHWKCQCECGKIVSRSSNALKMAKIPSCGCYNNQKEAHIIDIIGKKIGKLTVISRNDEYAKSAKQQGKGRDTYWNCQCDCGRICIRSKSSLNVSNANKYNACCDFCHYLDKDLNKRRFNLTMLYPTGEKRNNYNIWHCKCDCGNEIDLTTNELSWTISCGCMQHKSRGEIKIENILKNNHIKYIYNKGYFKDLIYPSKAIGRYDFILFNDNDEPFRLIEFDGKQHYSEEANVFFCGPNNINTFKQIQEHDRIKNEYAKTHNLPLVRIPYTMLNKLTLETILGNEFVI